MSMYRRWLTGADVPKVYRLIDEDGEILDVCVGSDAVLRKVSEGSYDDSLACAVCGLFVGSHNQPVAHRVHIGEGRRPFVWSDDCFAAVSLDERF